MPLGLASPIAQIITFCIVYCSAGQKEVLPNSVLIIQDVFLNFAAGTFIGICFEDIINVEMLHNQSKTQICYKFLTFLGGFAIIVIATVFEFCMVD